MKNGMLAIGVVALTAMGTTNAFAQKKPAKCTKVPLTVEILAIGPDNTGALDGDAKGRIYTEGVDGVYNTVINLCSGSNDATVGLGRRSMVMRFPDHADGPIWAGNDILTKPFLNVRDLLLGTTKRIGVNVHDLDGLRLHQGPGRPRSTVRAAVLADCDWD